MIGLRPRECTHSDISSEVTWTSANGAGSIQSGIGAVKIECMEEVVTLYRPCGKAELDLVAALEYKAWPPRLPIQPIFYPVTNIGYAREVNVWNVNQYGKGYITEFQVKKVFMDRYRIETVGNSSHTEWWIPAKDLDEMNANIVGLIRVVEESP